ncbi:MAG: PIG-L family deacetylase [Firmicutes bacterium]|nr:PIG-L family deacetylase [Bacillota bacterium]
MKRVLVFAPHPDDDLIGCGGSMAKHARNGALLKVVFLTSGGAGSITRQSEPLAEIREAEAVRAARIIGIAETEFLRRPDGYLEYSRENLIEVTRIIRGFRPDLVYTPHEKEQHPDHVVASRLVLECCRRAGGPWFREYEGQPWSVPTVLGYEVGTPIERVSYTEDISDFMELKLEALREHRSQLEAIDYHDAVRGLNRYRGAMTGGGVYCECFQVYKTGTV